MTRFFLNAVCKCARKRPGAVICAIFILALGPMPAIASDKPEVWRSRDLILIFDKRLESYATDIKRHFPLAKQELEEGFGWVLEVRPTVILIRTREEFQRIVPGPLFVAIAIPHHNTIVIDTSRVQTAPHTLKITFTHELAHLLLHQYIDNERLPRWLDEGICQWFTGGAAEVILDRHRPMLGKALGSGEHIPLSDLTHRFPSDPRQLMLAYEQSRDIVTMIANQYGPENILGILDRLRAGESVESSIELQLGITLSELEKLWQNHLRDTAVWWGRLANHIYSILFFLAAVLTVAGVVIRRMRRKRQFEDEDEDGDFY